MLIDLEKTKVDQKKGDPSTTKTGNEEKPEQKKNSKKKGTTAARYHPAQGTRHSKKTGRGVTGQP